MPSQEPIIHLAASQAGQASGVLARAFHDDPASRYLWPDAAGRARLLPWIFSTGIRYGLLYGQIYGTRNLDGVAVWVAPGHAPMTLGRMYRAGMLAAPFKMGIAAVVRYLNFSGYVEALHKRSAPGRHWYLYLLVVEPARQGRGIGGRLIQPALAAADGEKLPCYLETMNGRNVPFYIKHGFSVVAEGQMPRGGPYVWGLLREPR